MRRLSIAGMIPLLLLLADPSDSVVPADDRTFVATHGGAQVTTEVFEGQGHTLHRTAFERYIGTLGRFIGSLP